jgi:hypothetical protein
MSAATHVELPLASASSREDIRPAPRPTPPVHDALSPTANRSQSATSDTFTLTEAVERRRTYHDDHTGGMSAVLRSCTSATFFCSAFAVRVLVAEDKLTACLACSYRDRRDGTFMFSAFEISLVGPRGKRAEIEGSPRPRPPRHGIHVPRSVAATPAP